MQKQIRIKHGVSGYIAGDEIMLNEHDADRLVGAGRAEYVISDHQDDPVSEGSPNTRQASAPKQKQSTNKTTTRKKLEEDAE